VITKPNISNQDWHHLGSALAAAHVELLHLSPARPNMTGQLCMPLLACCWATTCNQLLPFHLFLLGVTSLTLGSS
jgi:hypothetical protein